MHDGHDYTERQIIALLHLASASTARPLNPVATPNVGLAGQAGARRAAAAAPASAARAGATARAASRLPRRA